MKYHPFDIILRNTEEIIWSSHISLGNIAKWASEAMSVFINYNTYRNKYMTERKISSALFIYSNRNMHSTLILGHFREAWLVMILHHHYKWVERLYWQIKTAKRVSKQIMASYFDSSLTFDISICRMMSVLYAQAKYRRGVSASRIIIFLRCFTPPMVGQEIYQPKYCLYIVLEIRNGDVVSRISLSFLRNRLSQLASSVSARMHAYRGTIIPVNMA